MNISGNGKQQEDRRVVRLLRIIVQIAEDPGRWTRAELATQYDVSERMITKDFAVLRAAGLRLAREHPPGGYYFVTPPGREMLRIAGQAHGSMRSSAGSVS